LATDVLGLSTHEKWAGLLAIVLVVPMGIIRGTLIGQDRYKDYSLLIAGEGALRLICFAAFLLMGEVNLEQLEIAVVIGFACWIPWSKTLRAYVTNESFKKTLSNSILVMFLTLGSAFFLVGVPWVAARNSEVTLTQIAIFSAASMLARVPMLIFSAIQALLIPHFLRQADDKEIGRQAVALRILLVAALSIVVAYLLGPTVLTLIFGTFYTIGHLTFALLVLSTWFLILQLVNVAKLISLNRHFFAGLSWVPGVITSSTMLINWATDVDKITYAVVVGSALCLLSSNQFVRKLKHSQISG
jgi:O-antigen/teichoic acid export membrane protein